MKTRLIQSIITATLMLLSYSAFAHDGDGDGGSEGSDVTIEDISGGLDFSTKLTNNGEGQKNMKLIQQKTPVQLGVTDGSTITDLWGWTDPRNGDRYIIATAAVDNPTVLEGDPEGIFEPKGGVVFARVNKKGKITPLGVWEHPDSSASNPLAHGDVKVFNNYAYAMFEREGESHGDGTAGSGGKPFGIMIFNLKKLKQVKNINTGPNLNDIKGFAKVVTDFGLGSPLSDSHNIAIDENTGYMAIYVASLQTDSDQPPTLQNTRPLRTLFLKIDEDNPIPYVIAEINDEGGHDGRIFRYKGSNPNLKGKIIHVSADGYVAAFRFFDDGVDLAGAVMYQLADKYGTNVKFLGRANYANIDIVSDLGYADSEDDDVFKFGHSLTMSQDHEWIMIDDEDNNNIVDSRANIIFIKTDNVVDGNPNTNESFFCLHPEASVGHNKYLIGNSLYRSNYTSGIRVVDVSKISKSALCPDSITNTLTEVAFYDTEPRLHGTDSSILFVDPENELTLVANTNFSGSWSLYPEFDGYIVAADFFNGLITLKRTDLKDKKGLKRCINDAKHQCVAHRKYKCHYSHGHKKKQCLRNVKKQCEKKATKQCKLKFSHGKKYKHKH